MNDMSRDEIPENWTMSDLITLSETVRDGSHNPPSKQESGIPMLSARNIENGQIVFDDYRYISPEAFAIEDARTPIRPGDVLLTIVGTIGRSAVVPDNAEPFALQRSVAILKPRGMLPKLMMCQLISPGVQHQLLKEARGTARKGVYLKSLSKITMVLPSSRARTDN